MNIKRKVSALFTTFFETIRSLDNIKKASYQILKLVLNLVKSIDLKNIGKYNNEILPYISEFVGYLNMACIESIKTSKLEITLFLLNKFKDILEVMPKKSQDIFNIYESNQLIYNVKIGNLDYALTLERNFNYLTNNSFKKTISFAILLNNTSVSYILYKKNEEAEKYLYYSLSIVEPLVIADLRSYTKSELLTYKDFREKLKILLIIYCNYSAVLCNNDRIDKSFLLLSKAKEFVNIYFSPKDKINKRVYSIKTHLELNFKNSAKNSSNENNNLRKLNEKQILAPFYHTRLSSQNSPKRNNNYSRDAKVYFDTLKSNDKKEQENYDKKLDEIGKKLLNEQIKLLSELENNNLLKLKNEIENNKSKIKLMKNEMIQQMKRELETEKKEIKTLYKSKMETQKTFYNKKIEALLSEFNRKSSSSYMQSSVESSNKEGGHKDPKEESKAKINESLIMKEQGTMDKIEKEEKSFKEETIKENNIKEAPLKIRRDSIFTSIELPYKMPTPSIRSGSKKLRSDLPKINVMVDESNDNSISSFNSKVSSGNETKFLSLYGISNNLTNPKERAFPFDKKSIGNRTFRIQNSNEMSSILEFVHSGLIRVSNQEVITINFYKYLISEWYQLEFSLKNQNGKYTLSCAAFSLISKEENIINLEIGEENLVSMLSDLSINEVLPLNFICRFSLDPYFFCKYFILPFIAIDDNNERKQKEIMLWKYINDIFEDQIKLKIMNMESYFRLFFINKNNFRAKLISCNNREDNFEIEIIYDDFSFQTVFQYRSFPKNIYKNNGFEECKSIELLVKDYFYSFQELIGILEHFLTTKDLRINLSNIKSHREYIMFAFTIYTSQLNQIVWVIVDDINNESIEFHAMSVFTINTRYFGSKKIKKVFRYNYDNFWKEFGTKKELLSRSELKSLIFVILKRIKLVIPQEDDGGLISSIDVELQLDPLKESIYKRFIIKNQYSYPLTMVLHSSNDELIGIKCSIYSANNIIEEGVYLLIQHEYWEISDNEKKGIAKKKSYLRDNACDYSKLPIILTKRGFDKIFSKLNLITDLDGCKSFYYEDQTGIAHVIRLEALVNKEVL